MHFCRNAFSRVRQPKLRDAAEVLMVIHAAEDAQAPREEARQVVVKQREAHLAEAAGPVRASFEEMFGF